MKAIVKPDRIELNHFLFTIIFPKGSEQLSIIDNSGVGIHNILLRVKSDNQRIESPLGEFMGLILYNIRVLLASLSRWHSFRHWYNGEPNIIYKIEDIKKCLLDLKNNGYNVSDLENQFNLIKHKSYNKKAHRALWILVIIILLVIIISILDKVS